MNGNDELKELLGEETLDNFANALWVRDFDSVKMTEEFRGVLENKKNIKKSFGNRMKARLNDLLENTESFNPNYKRLYETLLEYADALTPHQAYAMSILLGLDSARGYRKIPFQAKIKLPDDDAPQFEYQVGWHFFVGSCWDSGGTEYGVEFMFYQHALLPPPLAKKFGISSLENQILELHLAISRAGDTHYRSQPIIVSGTSGLVGFEGHPYRYKLGKNQIKSMDTMKLFPLEIKSWGIDQSFNEPVEIGISLFLDQTKDYILQGKNGCSQCCGGVGTLYYSVPGLRLDPKFSKLRIGDDEVSLAKGKFWYDHQWGTGFLPPGSPREPVLRAANNLSDPPVGGWDWFMAQFDGDHELSMYALHSSEKLEFYHKTGAQPPGILEVNVKGKYITPDSKFKDVKGGLKIDKWIKSEKSQCPELYPVTNAWYPDQWHFRFDDDVPVDIRDFTMTPIVEGGQTGYFATGMHYSEGAVYVKNPDGKLIGRGFAESTNYADSMKNVLELAGLPTTEDMLNKMKTPGPSRILKLKSILYLNLPSNKKKLEEILPPCLEGL